MVLDTPLEDTEASEDTLTRGRLGLKLFIKMAMLTTKLFILPMLNLAILLMLSLTTATETGWMQDGLSEKTYIQRINIRNILQINKVFEAKACMK